VPDTLRHELARKAIHLASAVVPVSYALGLPRETLLLLLGGALAIALTVELMRRHLPSARAAFERRVGVLLREHERGRWSGATWMAIAYLLSVALFPRAVAVAAMLAVALGDAAAAIVGRWSGARAAARTGAATGRKTWAGSIACAVATALGALLVARLGPGTALACGLAAALAERPDVPIDDNVRVALAAGGGAQLVAVLTPYLAS
jgi:dolichol kinase